MQLIFKTTADGSHTLFAPEIGECYHSMHGAFRESQQVFVEYGFMEALKTFAQINVLEIGFGTGLNALLTLLKAVELNVSVNYTSIEPFPIDMGSISLLNYPLLAEPEDTNYFASLHFAEWDKWSLIAPCFSVQKIRDKVQDIVLPEKHFHLVYMDAFSPEKQPEVWQQDVFNKIACASVKGCILTTYCCKGIVKRALKTSGFSVKKIPGPPGKREVLRAVKTGDF